MHFTECVDPKKCQYLLTLKKGQYEHLFPKSDGDNETANASGEGSSYFCMLNYCKKQKAANFALEVEYARSRLNSTKGRLYAQGVSLQNMRSAVRMFLTDGIYRDYDMCNAHPTFLLHFCRRLPADQLSRLPCQMLYEYCTDREQFLQYSYNIWHGKQIGRAHV